MNTFSVRSFAALLTFLATLGLAPGVAAQADVVQLTFGWPTGLAADVTAASRVTIESIMVNQMETSEFSFELAMEDHADGIRVSSRNFDFGEDEAATPEDEFAQQMQGMRPVLVVSRAGEFVGLEGVEEIAAAVSAATDSMAGPGGESIASIFGEMDEDFWVAQATTDWNLRVGLWAGKEFRMGEVVTVRGQQQFPGFGSESLPVNWDLEYRGTAACNDEDDGDSCVSLVVTTTPNAEALAEAMRGFIAEMLSDLGPAAMQVTFEVDEVSVESQMVMVVEPGTLLPHSVTTDLMVSQAISMMGQSQESVNRTHEVMTYVYRR